MDNGRIMVSTDFYSGESKCLFNLYAEYIIRNAGLEEAQVESRLPGEISIISVMQMTPPLWQKVKRNSKAS